MREFDAKVKQWGNSMGIIIPKDIVKEQKLKPNKMIRLMVPPKDDTLEAAWGLLGPLSKKEQHRLTADFLKQRNRDCKIERERTERFSSSIPVSR